MHVLSSCARGLGQWGAGQPGVFGRFFFSGIFRLFFFRPPGIHHTLPRLPVLAETAVTLIEHDFEYLYTSSTPRQLLQHAQHLGRPKTRNQNLHTLGSHSHLPSLGGVIPSQSSSTSTHPLRTGKNELPVGESNPDLPRSSMTSEHTDRYTNEKSMRTSQRWKIDHRVLVSAILRQRTTRGDSHVSCEAFGIVPVIECHPLGKIMAKMWRG